MPNMAERFRHKNPPLFYLVCLRSFGALSGWAYPEYRQCDMLMIMVVMILVTMNERQQVLSL